MPRLHARGPRRRLQSAQRRRQATIPLPLHERQRLGARPEQETELDGGVLFDARKSPTPTSPYPPLPLCPPLGALLFI